MLDVLLFILLFVFSVLQIVTRDIFYIISLGHKGQYLVMSREIMVLIASKGESKFDPVGFDPQSSGFRFIHGG